MRVLVTGASGYIGQHVVRALLGAGREVIALTRRPEALERLRAPGLSVDARGFTEEPPRDLIESGMSVIHLAGVRSRPGARSDEFERVNVTATARLGEACAEAGVSRFVNIGTALIEGPEEFVRRDPYLQSKIAGLERLEALGELPLITILPTIVFGPRIPNALNRVTEHIRFVLRTPVVPLVGQGDAPRNLAYIDDVVRAIVEAERSELRGRHVVSGEDVSNDELDRKVIAISRRRKLMLRVPWPMAKQAARFADILRRFEQSGGYRHRLEALALAWPARRQAVSEIQNYATPFDDALERTVASLLKV